MSVVESSNGQRIDLWRTESSGDRARFIAPIVVVILVLVNVGHAQKSFSEKTTIVSRLASLREFLVTIEEQRNEDVRRPTRRSSATAETHWQIDVTRSEGR